MQFNSGYYHPMDRAYDSGLQHDVTADAPTAPMGVVERPDLPELDTETKESISADLGIKDVGMSVPLGIAATNVQGVQAKIWAGAGNIEIGFPGAIRGQRNAQTPEMWGAEQRRALREIAKVNEVNFTTHSSYNLPGLSGTDQHGNFSWQQRKMAVDEVRRAIEFAADVHDGGSVVVHTGEYDRPISEQPWARDKTGRLLFKQYFKEPEQAVFRVIDDRTGQVMSTVQKNKRVARPIWNVSKEQNPYTDANGNIVEQGDYIDYEGKKIIDPYDSVRGRVPEYSTETGRFKVKMMTYDDFVEEAKKRNEFMEQKLRRPLTPEELTLPEEEHMRATLETQEGHSRGWALQYAQSVQKEMDALRKLRELREFYEKLDKDLPEEEKWKLLKSHQGYARFSSMLTPETKHPLAIIDEEIKDLQRGIEFSRQASVSQEQQAQDTAETKEHIKAAIKRVWEAGFRGYAEGGIYAMEKSKDPSHPIMITLENIFPERYGGHPAELKELIEGSRKEMVRLLTEKKINNPDSTSPETKIINNPYYHPEIGKQEAENLAEKHIKATIDTAHANLWRKYYQDDPTKTREQNDANFDKWLVSQFEDLAKAGMIGNVHLVDNYGYQDDHLAPGEGNAPVREVVKMLKKYGYKGAYTVEPGADASTNNSDFHGLMKTWRHFGSPVYGLSGPTRMGAPQNSWTDVQYSYFGRTYPPYFIFGAYAPSNDWTLWTGVPME